VAVSPDKNEDFRPVTVRAARPGDYQTIVGVVDNWWGRPVTSSLPRLFLEHFWNTSLVVEDEQGLAGFLVGFISPSEPQVAYIHFVGVRPDLRKSGLGRRLYGEFAHRIQAEGCSELRAITAPANGGSIRFHERLGFVASEPLADYNGPGNLMVTFRRQLQ